MDLTGKGWSWGRPPNGSIWTARSSGTSGRQRGTPAKWGQALGRSRGGLTTKLHAIVHDDRLPLVMALTPGQFGDATWGRHLLEQLGPQTGCPQLVADRAGYRAKSLAERFRGLATSYHKLDVVYLHMVYLPRIDVAML